MRHLLLVLALTFAPITFAACPPGTDTDGDGIADSCDNCINVSNVLQRDSDGDGCGNFCDADFNNDGMVNFTDLAEFKANIFSHKKGKYDLDDSGFVNHLDLDIVKSLFFKPACGD